jgi:hypothetical protein
LKQKPSATIRDASALIAGLFWGPVGVFLCGVAAALDGPLLVRILLVVVGATLVIRFVPRAAMIRLKEMREMDPLNRYLVGPARVACPCCMQPTLEPEVEDQTCLLCEWSVVGMPANSFSDADGVEQARKRFRQHLSVYSPDSRPIWSPNPPSTEEVELRKTLLEAYRRIRARSKDGLGPIWEETQSLERRLVRIEEARASDN